MVSKYIGQIQKIETARDITICQMPSIRGVP